MPSLFRFLIVVVILGILGGAGMIYLAVFVGPHTREMTVRVSTEKLQVQQPASPAQQPPRPQEPLSPAPSAQQQPLSQQP